MRSALKQLPVFLAVYAMLVFTFGTMITQALVNANSGSATGPGIWVQLCASGQKIFMPLPEGSEMPAGENGENPGQPAPSGPSAKACHACNDRRTVDDGDGLEDIVV